MATELRMARWIWGVHGQQIEYPDCNQIHSEHHRKKTFQEEYLEFLRANGIKYDERYLWG